MKAVMSAVPQHLLDERKRTGAHRWDEMWEGVLHMPPMPSRSHQDFQATLEMWLRIYWTGPSGGRVFHEINVASAGGWPNDYRVPDMVLLKPDRFFIDHDVYFEGAPSVVVEIRSPDDESYEKLSFYARLGVPEAWIIDRDDKTPEIYRLRGGIYELAQPAADGWLRSAVVEVQMREQDGKLAVQIPGDGRTLQLLP